MDPETIIAAISAASTLINTLAPVIEERRRNSELTPAQEAEWDRIKAEAYAQAHWQPSGPQVVAIGTRPSTPG